MIPYETFLYHSCLDIPENLILMPALRGLSCIHCVRERLRIYHLYVRAVVLYFTIPLIVRHGGLMIAVDACQSRISHPEDDDVSRIIETIEKVLYFLKNRLRCKKNFCLRKSIVLLHCFRKFGLQTDLNVGINFRAENDVVGHCWLSRNDEVIHETNIEYRQYNRLFGKKDFIQYWVCSS